MPVATFDGPNKRILLTPPVGESETSVLVGSDIYSDWKEWVCQSDNSKYTAAMRATGGDDLGGGQKMGSYFFIANQDGWRIKPLHENTDLHVLELIGNLFPEDPDQPMFEWTLGTNVVVTMNRSALVTVVQMGGSALTQTEHDRLMGLPQTTLETDERTKLMSISPSGLTQQEHDQLMAVPLTDTGLLSDERTKLMGLPDTTLETDERTHLLAIPTTAGGLTPEEHDQLMAIPLVNSLTVEEHDQLMAIPLTDTPGGLTQAEHDQLMALFPGGLTQQEHDHLLALPTDVLSGALAELGVGAIPKNPTPAQALMLLYMMARDKVISAQSSVKLHNDAGQQIAQGVVSVAPDGTVTREKLS